jgi:tRNA1(Val) A37 N6-methylase TrmN6
MRSRPANEIPFPVTDDAVLGGRLQLLQPARGHRAGHDAILLAAAAPKAKHAVDLGAGIGTAGLALLARRAAERVTLIEIDENLAALARKNAERNGFRDRADVLCADATEIDRAQAGGADLVLMNPPFNDPARAQASPDPTRRQAHVGKDSDLGRWIDAARRLLEPGGRLVLIHRPEAEATILAALAGFAVELIPVLPRANATPIRLIVRATEGAGGEPVLLPGIVLNGPDNRPSDMAEAILRHAAPLDPA